MAIHRCLYKVIPEEMCSTLEGSRYFFFQNVAHLSPVFERPYEKYEARQQHIRAQLTKEELENNPELYAHMRNAIIGTSAISNQMVLIANLDD